MKQELEDDQESNNLYISTRLNERGKQFYPELFKKAIDEGDETMFGIDLISHGCLTQMYSEMES
jgi:hypothetical protein